MNIWDELSAIGEAAQSGTWDGVPTDLSSRLSEAKELFEMVELSNLIRFRENNELVQENLALRAENDSLTALAKFGQWVLNTREEGGEGTDFGSKAIELGLLAEVMATEPCGDKCLCDTWTLFPQKCLRLTDKAKVLDHGPGPRPPRRPPHD